MKTEDWKAKLMDYLYDELNPAEKEAFEEELTRNSELREELKAFQNEKNVLGNLEDEKVSAPPFFNVQKRKNFSIVFKKYTRSINLVLIKPVTHGLFIKMRRGRQYKGVKILAEAVVHYI
jgi:hypothetical protein